MSGSGNGRVGNIVALSPEARRVLDAFLATAVGTAAGILADSGFGLRKPIVDAVYGLLQPLFDVFSEFPNGQLLFASFIYSIPVVLMLGMAGGLILRHFRYPQLLLVSTLVWPACLLARRMIATFDHASPALPVFSRTDLAWKLVLYSMQYALLILAIRATSAAVVRAAQCRSVAAARAGPAA
jgi:hypothetical protein